jgi:hypothetical protein
MFTYSTVALVNSAFSQLDNLSHTFIESSIFVFCHLLYRSLSSFTDLVISKDLTAISTCLAISHHHTLAICVDISSIDFQNASFHQTGQLEYIHITFTTA